MPCKHPLVLALSLLCSTSAFGQSVTTPTIPNPSEIKRVSIPLDHLYRLFLESQIAIDNGAAELQRHGQLREAAFRRQYRQQSLHLSDVQMAAVRQAAQQAQKDKTDLWTKAMPTMLQDREWRKLNGPTAGHAPGHAQVDAWQKDNEAKLHRTIAQLNRRLGPSAAARLQSHIQSGESKVPPSNHPLIHLQSVVPGVQR